MDPERARSLDALDELAGFRSRFHLPDRPIYLDGNSLGPPTVDAEAAIAGAIATWRSEAVLGWDRWIDLGVELGDELAPLIGAEVGTVAVGDQTSVNLYKLATAALRHVGRASILTDAGNFPSDRYVLAGVAEAAGGSLVVAPEDAEPDQLATHLGPDIGLVALTHVAYRSGRLHDAATITGLAHDAGALVLWDLAHSAGAVPVHLGTWQADIAVGCTYKYLNGGPGSPGFLHVRSDLVTELHQPIQGWFGHADMFGFADRYLPAPNIRRYLVGTPPVLALAATGAGIRLTAEAGIERIRAKSESLGRLFVELAEPVIGEHGGTLASPLDARRRGSHVSIRHEDAFALSLALRDAGVVVDFRTPDIVRFGFAPLYVRHADVVAAVEILAGILASGEHHRHRADRHGVT